MQKGLGGEHMTLTTFLTLAHGFGPPMRADRGSKTTSMGTVGAGAIQIVAMPPLRS